jgi:lipopolysaccharide export system protein LptC
MPVGPGLYSRIVMVLKVALPLVAVGMLSALFLIQPDDRIGGDLVFSRGDLAALGSGLRISDATFSGTTRGEASFSFLAAAVVPDAAPPTYAEITDITGAIDMADGPMVEVRAERGALDIAAQRLELAGEVAIETSDGYSIYAETVTLDLRAGTMTAGEPVLTEGPLGRIEARTLTVTPAVATGEAAGDARRFSFGNDVRVLYDPPSPAE